MASTPTPTSTPTALRSSLTTLPLMGWAEVGVNQPSLALVVVVVVVVSALSIPQPSTAALTPALSPARTLGGRGRHGGGGSREGYGQLEVDLRQVLPEANLDNNTVAEVFFNVGEVALLPCHFPQLSTLHQKAFLLLQVSWIRRADWHILTTGVYTYTTDTRFSVLHQEGSDDWTLQIKYAKMRDRGTYECQMYTGTGVLSKFVNLHVSTPRAAILGPRELHVQEGDTITLICVIQQGKPPFVFWYQDQYMVNYNSRLSVETHVEGTRTHSRLTISHARSRDSGNYSCIPPNVQPSFVLVYVNEAGDNVAAVQRPPSSSAPAPISAPLYFLLVVQLMANLLDSFLLPLPQSLSVR